MAEDKHTNIKTLTTDDAFRLAAECGLGAEIVHAADAAATLIVDELMTSGAMANLAAACHVGLARNTVVASILHERLLGELRVQLIAEVAEVAAYLETGEGQAEMRDKMDQLREHMPHWFNKGGDMVPGMEDLARGADYVKNQGSKRKLN
jgi:hypothetical protein